MRCNIPDSVAEMFQGYEPSTRRALLYVRDLIFRTAEEEPDAIGRIEEALRWGEPAYLTSATQSGSTIRNQPDCPVILFNCKTLLVSEFRDQYSDVFEFVGNRALIIGPDYESKVHDLAACIRAALTYHLRRKL